MGEKSSRKGLGTGLSALFGEDIYAEDEAQVLTLPISKVEPRSDQPRRIFDMDALEELADSIRQYGLIQPITVRKLPTGYYQIIAGERRWRAARMAELNEIPVRVIEADDRRAAELALVENLQREDLNPMEEARGFKKLMDEYGLTQEEAASAVGKSRPAIANSLRLLGLSAGVMELVEAGELSAGHARALIPIYDPERQLSAAMRVVSEGLSVRQTEALAARLKKQSEELYIPELEEYNDEIKVDYLEIVRHELERSLARKVKISEGRKRGKIEIEFYGADDREALIKALMSIRNQ